MSEALPWHLRWRLSVLWALQWGITGSILTYLPLYFTKHTLNSVQIGQLMAVSAIGLLVAPFVVGQICDRWLSSNKYLAMAHLVGGLTLLCVPLAAEIYRETQDNFGTLLLLVTVYAIAYFPTIPLASSLSFRHLPDPDSQFSKVRIWGTVGWVISGLVLSLWLGQSDALAWLRENFPDQKPAIQGYETFLNRFGDPASGDSFRIAAILSFMLSSFCIMLPHTPPLRTGKAKGKVAPLEVLSMFRDPQFCLMIGISFALAIIVPTYSYAVPRLLENLDVKDDWVPAVMTVGQISEFPALILLPLCLRKLQLKATFALGMLAWVVRYTLFAFDVSMGWILFGIALHGVCHVYLVIVIQLYVDNRCRPDLRASAQNLFAFVTMGVAMPIGFLLAGALGHTFKLDHPEHANYQGFFFVDATVMAVLLVVFWFSARISREKPSPDPANP
ncbi:MAG: MFS transporter [Planctomycetaceae bacterium]|nr:MFS transporter [Planctomycetaceae bacterium]